MAMAASAVNADAGADNSNSLVPVNGTIGYVMTNLFWSVYQTPDAKDECPNGFNDGPREQFEILFPAGQKRTVVDTQLKQEIETWRQSMHINLDGPFYLTRLVLREMVRQKYGRLVYTSSTSAEVAERAGSAYNSSKSGLLGLMRSAAQDGGAHGITSNAVLPGWVRTEMAERSARAEAEERKVSTDQIWEERAALYPPGRVATPAEVAEVLAFLASEESSGVSGQAIAVALGSVL